MGYRDVTAATTLGPYPYRAIEVAPVMKDKDHNRGPVPSLFILVDGETETLRFVQENLFDIVNNVLRVRKMKPTRRSVDENARIFERNLKSLFTLAAGERGTNLLDEMTYSLKKALIILAMERYRNDRDRICRILGISRDTLEQEMLTCGLI